MFRQYAMSWLALIAEVLVNKLSFCGLQRHSLSSARRQMVDMPLGGPS